MNGGRLLDNSAWARLTLLHYDHDFDRLREHTGLELAAEWLAPAGSL